MTGEGRFDRDERRRAFDEAVDAYLESLVDSAMALRSKLRIEEGEAASLAGEAILDLVDARLEGRPIANERAYLARIFRNKLTTWFGAEIPHVDPRAHAEYEHRRDVRKLEREIKAAEEDGRPMPAEEIARRRAKLDDKLGRAVDREYLGDDGVSEVGVPELENDYDRLVDGLGAKECVARMFAHPGISGQGLTGRAAEAARRRRIALTEMLAHEGRKIPGWVWTMYGWEPDYGATLKNETLAWIRCKFPDIGELFS
jgi:DNA-directed RNA polymerase specialized sigma24 family protein